MAKIRITLTKPRNEEWFLLSDKDFVERNFTPDEIQNVLNPRKELLVNCKGFISQRILDVDATKKIITYEFETLEDAYRANEIAKLGVSNINAKKPDDDEFSILVRNRKLILGSNIKAEIILE